MEWEVDLNNIPTLWLALSLKCFPRLIYYGLLARGALAKVMEASGVEAENSLP